MATLVIRNLEDTLRDRLKQQAAAHRRSMEEEARQILRQSLAAAPLQRSHGFGQAMRTVFEPLGGLDLPEIPREPPRDPPDFSGPEWDRRA
jgi:plasmid stability protein